MALVSLEQFKNTTLGNRYGVPGTNNTQLGDPAYAGQCVSYIRQYMEKVLGIKTQAWGHAVDYWTNPAVLKHFDKVKTPQNGDIIVWGDDPGSWTGVYGHIGIWYKGDILNQNYGGNLKVTINDMFTPGLLGYLRRKDMLTKNQITHLYRIYYGRAPLDKEISAFVGKVTFDTMADKLRLSDAYKKRVALAKGGNYNAKNHLPNDIRAVYVEPATHFEVVTETLYRKKLQ